MEQANTGAQREEETNSEMTAMRARCASVLVEVKVRLPLFLVLELPLRPAHDSLERMFLPECDISQAVSNTSCNISVHHMNKEGLGVS